MKRMLLTTLVAMCALFTQAQLLSWTPPFPSEDNAAQTLVITVDATKGNAGLLNYTPTNDVYVHTGVITTQSTGPTNWRYVKFNQNFNQPNAQLQANYIGNNKWTFTIPGSLKAYYGVPANETILKIAILFRNGAGTRVQRNTDASDMYVPVYPAGLQTRIDLPARQPKYVPDPEPQNWVVGTNFTVTASASQTAQLKLYHNSTTPFATVASGTTITGNSTVMAIGNQQIIVEATAGSVTKYDTLNVFVSPSTSPTAALPAGLRDGINYLPGDTALTLVLRAPGKTKATVIGEFNNWTQSTSFIMNRTPDGNQFWLRVGQLTPGQQYAYQFIVDDTLRIADPYAELVLDPNNDQFITAATYPNLKPYPAGQTGIVSVFQPGQAAYNWQVPNFTRPDKRGLVIYELLVRDFVAAHDWKTVTDSLNYLKNLGVNAIQIMPFNEFEGNISWGYNGSYFFAPDKYYGPKNTLKAFIDSCHKRGIAVIMDIALNHHFGQSPMVQLYWDAANSRPASNSPWFNPTPRHAFNVGYDMNHESLETRYYTSRVIEHWLQNYKIDGFRWDLSKGFTQTQTCDVNGGNCNVGGWSAYDQSRVNIWKRYYDSTQLKAPGSIQILEHFADNSEEIELSNYGFLLWGNMNHSYNQATMGYATDWDFSGAIASVRNWTRNHLVSYMESHDEERIVYKNINFGNSAGSYNVRDTTIALRRMELGAAFLLTIPGPKMIWQFGELGYPYSINTCEDGTVNNNCRLSPKPIRWDYLADQRRRNIYTVYSKLNALRQHPWYRDALMAGTVERALSQGFKWIKVTTPGDTSDLVVVGNFDVTQQGGLVQFPTAGTWYDYLNNTQLTTTGAPQSITLAPGEYRVYLNRNVNASTPTPVNPVLAAELLSARAWPNPARDQVTLSLNLPQPGMVTVDLFNVSGQSVGRLYSGFLARGAQQVQLNTQSLARGVYYLKLGTRSGFKTISVTLH